MTDKRTISIHPDLHSWFASEDGRNFRGHSQEMNPVFDHVRYMDDHINRGSEGHSRNKWRYAGSMPMAWLVDWLQKNHCTMHQWATNQGGMKDKCLREFQSREYHKFHAHNMIKRA